MGKQAQLKDIYSGIGSMKAAIHGLPENDLSSDQLVKLQAILRESDDSLRGTLWTNFIGSQRLTPEEMDCITALQQLRERALSVRNRAAMGVGSDQQRAQFLNSLPGVLSGNRDMTLNQLGAFENFVDNLATGVPHVGGATPIHAAASGSKPPSFIPGGQSSTVRIKASDGSIHELPSANLSKARQRDPGLKVIQ